AGRRRRREHPVHQPDRTTGVESERGEHVHLHLPAVLGDLHPHQDREQLVSLDRRTLFRAGGVAAAASAMTMTTGRHATATPTRGKHAAGGPRTSSPPPLTPRNPLVEQRADPFVTRPVNGMYYLTGSVPEYDRVVIRGASTLDGLAEARERTIWRRP